MPTVSGATRALLSSILSLHWERRNLALGGAGGYCAGDSGLERWLLPLPPWPGSPVLLRKALLTPDHPAARARAPEAAAAAALWSVSLQRAGSLSSAPGRQRQPRSQRAPGLGQRAEGESRPTGGWIGLPGLGAASGRRVGFGACLESGVCRG